MGETGYTNSLLQYWYILVALGVGFIVLCVFNCALYCYFSRRKPIKMGKFFTDLKKEAQIQDEVSKNKIESQMLEKEDVVPSNKTVPIDPVLEGFRTEALRAHNEYRAKHGIGELQISNDLNQYAQMWAQRMAEMDRLVHSPMEWRLEQNEGESLGENVVLVSGQELTGRNMSEMWYAEGFKHEYQEYQKETKSFSQMIWASSRLVGFGRFVTSSGKWYGCAHYYPEGNLVGLFGRNVFPPK